jgi:hypothetical protein
MKGVHMARLLSVNVGRPREIAWRVLPDRGLPYV